jgi:hypothetical protein
MNLLRRTPAPISRFDLGERKAKFYPSCCNLISFAPPAQPVPVPRTTNLFANPPAPKPHSSAAPWPLAPAYLLLQDCRRRASRPMNNQKNIFRRHKKGFKRISVRWSGAPALESCLFDPSVRVMDIIVFLLRVLASSVPSFSIKTRIITNSFHRLLHGHSALGRLQSAPYQPLTWLNPRPSVQPQSTERRWINGKE